MRKVSLFFGLMIVFFGALIVRAEAAVLRLTPGSGSFILGGTFDVSVVMNTQDVSVNTVAVDLRFPADKLQIANPSLGKSIIQIWANPPTFSNQEGRIYFVGGIPAPGITTSEGIIQSFTFRVIAPGEARITFGEEETQVLANDGLGTDVLKQTSPAVFRLVLPPSQGPAVFSPTHPEQGRWYRDPSPILNWSKSAGSQGFSFSVDHDPNGFPDTVMDAEESETSLTELESGIWYFHVRERGGGVWSGVSHFFINIDRGLPAAFDIKVSPGERTSNRSPILRFFTTDSLSGLDHFEMKVVPLRSGPNDTTFFFEVGSPYQLSALEPGRYEVIVRAADKAGNIRDESVTLNIVSSIFQFVSPEGIDLYLVFLTWDLFLFLLLIIVILILGLAVYFWWRHRMHLRHAFISDIRHGPRVAVRGQHGKK